MDSASVYLVVGLGKTGYSIARYLRRRNYPFVVFDTRANPPGLSEFSQEFPGVDVFCEEFPESLYDHITEIICSPGIPLDAQFMQKAVAKNIPIVGDIECLAREINVPLVAITGTNGKSTVTTLVGEMAKAAGISVAVAGNIGLPVLDILDVGVKYGLWVLELSSFQLDLTSTLNPIAATILNITPDHLDRHHTLEAYIRAKQRVYLGAHTIIFNRDDAQTYPQLLGKNNKIISFGLDEPQDDHWGLHEYDGQTYLMRGKTRLLAVSELRIKGRHNWSNALAACALSETIGITLDKMCEVLRRFSGLPHRSQWVRTLDEVDWINDSKGTNVGATVSAMSGIGSAMSGKIILIAGGQGKGADFSDLRDPVAEYARAVILIGEDAEHIEQALAHAVEVWHATSLKHAVQMAKEAALPGDVVLLSPACASFDMFRDFNHRGEEFATLVNGL